ncbi:hypothetical protein [Argonema galeatum]|uniref:hypothetical protein n=1 Tax=Argonema galeatum TaxID=2942762 RepID=UPI002012CBF6|nr:hypothetical protein [Argonema galeatum]MCL1465199.1 hypothetical protein [Argonema galeatum A003/A1]
MEVKLDFIVMGEHLVQVVSGQLSVVGGKNQDFQSNHWQFLVVSYFRHPALDPRVLGQGR